MNTTGNRLSDHPFFRASREGNNRLWAYAATLAAVLFLLLLWSLCLTIPLVLSARSLQSVLQLAEIPTLVISLISFAVIPPALWLGLRLFHKRGFRSLLLPAGPFRWGWFLASGGLWLALSLASDLILAQLQPGNYQYAFDPARFWPYLLAALLLFPVQISAEELVFRGYLTQSIGVKTGSFALAWVLPALAFGLLHGANPEIAAYGWLWMLPVYIGLGLVMGWIALRTAGLEASLGLHLANNLYASLCVTMAGSALPSPALFTIHSYDPRLGLAAFLLLGAIYVVFFELIRRKALARALLASVLFLTGCAPATSAIRTASPLLQLKDCTLSRSGLPIQVAAKCAKLMVSENPDQPDGRKISLNIAVIKAQSSAPAADPVFLLAGGPGQAATEAFLGVLSGLGKISFKHDLVLVDQRGTGSSNPLDCAEKLGAGLPLGREIPDEQVAGEFKACLGQWNADPRFYTTAYFVNDLETVRKALGYGPIDLLGVSYGTRSAMAYLKAYPGNVRAVVLDGVVPPGWVVGATLRGDAQRAMDLIFARCSSQPGCAKAFPDLKGDLEGLLAGLKAKTAVVTIPDPVSSKDLTVEVSDTVAQGMLRLISYNSAYATLIPWLVHTAAQGDLRPLAAQFAITQNEESSISTGLYYAVVCSEDAPFLPPGGESGNYFLAESTSTMKAVCSVYPSTPQADSERSYPTLQTPALILSGEADPVTPPANGAAVGRLLPNSKQIVVKGMGHGNATEGCIPNLIRQLFDEASLSKIDASCVERSAPPAFFTSSLGPEP